MSEMKYILNAVHSMFIRNLRESENKTQKLSKITEKETEKNSIKQTASVSCRTAV